MTERLGARTVRRVLDRLGIRSRPPATIAGLEEVYAAWCREVPWDNVRKRISLTAGQRVLAGAHPEEFFEGFLRHGTGGTCWPSSGALRALLAALGFEARGVTGTMDPGRWPGEINHASIVVRVAGAELLVDSSMLTARPVPLRRDAATALDDPLHPVRAEPQDSLWRIRWRVQSRDRDIDCVLVEDDVPHERCVEHYERSRVSGFSYFLTVVKNTPHGVVTLNGSRRAFRDRTGRLTVEDVPDRARVLIDEVGLSPEIVSALPPDEPDPRRPLPIAARATADRREGGQEVARG